MSYIYALQNSTSILKIILCQIKLMSMYDIYNLIWNGSGTSEISQGLCQCATWLGHYKTHISFDSIERKTNNIAVSTKWVQTSKYIPLPVPYNCRRIRHMCFHILIFSSYFPLTVPLHSHNRVFLYTIGLDIIANSFHCVHSTIWYPENLCSVRLGAPALATPKISVENSPFHAMCMRVKATEALINSVKVTESHFF